MPPKVSSKSSAAAGGSATAAAAEDLQKYQKMTDREHILKKPDTYIGTIEPAETIEYIMDVAPATADPAVAPATNGDAAPTLLTRRPITYIPGLYKLFDEGMVNMRDHVVRQAQAVADGKPDALPVTTLEVEIDPADGTIHMTNDGNGIDVAQHPEHHLWIPEMIFGHLRTSTNYDENKKEKIVGGKNGFGFKLVLIWSVWGRVETVDHVRGLKYCQEFRNNLSEIVPPIVTKSKVKPYTRVSFRPDYARFGLPANNLTADMVALFLKRTYDIAAVTDKTVKVKYNGALVPVRHFQQYVDLYIGAKGAAGGGGGDAVKRIYECPDPRWEYVVCLTTTDEFAHVSFVNGIYTPRGGKHVEYITNQIVRKLAEVIKKKKKVDVKPNTIKEQLMLFLRCDIENPSFSSQTKDELGTAVANFGSSCKVSDEFIEKLAKMGVMDAACALTEVKDTKAAKKTDGAKTRTIRGIPKLVDANYAGSPDKSAQCTIILCEGDSAKAGIISGLSKEDRNYIGVYPMKGKLFNVHGETTKRIAENREIAEIKQILGLEAGKTYTPADVATRLRYGKVLFMTDQDLDGAHIQGLGINLFQIEWPSLTKIPGFIGFMNTPILKARRGAQEVLFYNDGEFDAWKKQFPGEVVPAGWSTKYYKGLGTSTGKEFKEYFEHKKMVAFVHTGQSSDDRLDMAFNKKRADDRKEWLSNYSREAFLDTSKPAIPYEEFIDRGLIHFSIYDNERSIPNLMDGLKISLRKILYAAFKKGGLKTEIKVAQFSGYVSEHSAYHHGEASLNAAIVGMAQNFVGSNNINLFEPNGQFGCIDPETPVLLWNGNIEKAKNIKVGDKLVGDDGGCRIVSRLTEGVDEMYEVSNGNMDNYIVNSHHILTVCYSGHKSIFWKKSSNSWKMNYFDDDTNRIKSISMQTIDSTSGTHFNKTHFTKEEAYEKMLEYSKSIPDNNIFDINVQEYLALPEYVKHHVKGVINRSVVQWEEQELPIDPYILGLWLGDGMSMCNAFASMDSEIIKSWAIWTDTVGCEICHVKNIPPHENHSFYIRRRGSSTGIATAIGDPAHSRSTCIGCTTSKFVCAACDWTFEKRTDIVKGDGKNSDGHNVVNLNPVVELFKKHNLYNNKHVPIQYIINSEENRLKILAGMIDTDGCLKKRNGGSCCYEISQCEKRKHLLESFRIIAGSLGFRAKILKPNGNIYSLLITGDNIDKIPVKVLRKQIQNQTRTTNYASHNIKIKSIGCGAFCGWNIDKNERFLLGDFTITHNTRLHGGDDSASERYIFTQLNKLTRLIYRQEDDAVLSYIDDDGQMVEPIYYAPAIPMILVNGSKGIGTGFSTDVIPHNPLQIIAYIRAMLRGTADADRPVIEPYFKGFKGTIRNIAASATSGAPCSGAATNVAASSAAPAANAASATSGASTFHVAAKYLIKGTYEIIADRKVRITELPIGTWTDDYKEFLEKLMDAPAASVSDKDKGKDKAGATGVPVLKEYMDMSTDSVVDITVTFHPSYPHTPKDLQAVVVDADAGTNKLEKLLGLFTTQSTTNMNLFDAREKLRKYGTIYNVIEDYYVERLSLYSKRKAAMLAQLGNELRVLTNRARYIQEVLDDSLELRRQTKEAVFAKMTAHGYEHIEGDTEFKYLLKMPMDSVTDENVRHLLAERDSKRAQHKGLTDTTIHALWTKDLDELETEYKKWAAAAEAAAAGTTTGASGGGAAATKKKMVVKK
jgi:DNA gyrase/topoisomerase IV subunit B